MTEPETIDPRLAALLPEEQVATFQALCQTAGYRLTLEREFTDGYTDAIVIAAYLSADTLQARKLILKFSNGDGTLEHGRHELARAKGDPLFTKAHLVDQALPPMALLDGWQITFQEIANGALSDLVSMTSIEQTNALAPAVATVCEHVISKWSKTTKIEALTLADFLIAHTRRKLAPDSEFRSWLTAQLGQEVFTTAHLAFADSQGVAPLLNPLTAVVNPQLFGMDSTTVATILGCSHGDLHPGNILIPIKNHSIDSQQFRLIDLSEFEEFGPLSRDPISLLLSLLSHFLPTVTRSEKRQVLTILAGDKDGEVPINLVGFVAAARLALNAGDDSMASAGLLDEWRRQKRLSIVGMSLLTASRSNVDDQDKLWFIELAATIFDALFRGAIAEPENSRQPLIVGKLLDEKAREARNACEVILDACDSFSGSTATMVVFPPNIRLQRTDGIVAGGWDLVLDFDRKTDTDGGYAQLNDSTPKSRIVQFGQQPIFAPGTTTWLAAAGLAPLASDAELNAIDGRQWRQTHLRFVRESMIVLATKYTGPASIIVAGSTTNIFARSTLEAAIDAFGERLRIVNFSADSVDDALVDYSAEHIVANPELVCALFPPMHRQPATEPRIPPSLPSGNNSRQSIDQSSLSWLESHCDVLHSQCNRSADVEPGSRFYRGGLISWFELSLGIDIPRPGPVKILVDTLKRELAKGTRLVTLSHFPGAGGSTLARRAAWDLHDNFPVLVAAESPDPDELTTRVAEVARMTRLPVLLILENSGQEAARQIVNGLRPNSVSATILLVSRRTHYRTPDAIAGRIPDLDHMTVEEGQEFARLFGAMAPERRAELQKLIREPASVPFLFGLAAFADDYIGLSEYVSRSLVECTENVRSVLALTALAHRFGGQTLPSDLFALQLGERSDRPLDLRTRIGPASSSVLIEQTAGHWRTRHPLIAAELLRQLLNSSSSNSPNHIQGWTLGLSQWCKTLIGIVHDVYDEVVPYTVKRALEAMFLLRDSRDSLTDARREFSELISTIPSLEARIEVMRLLAETFPNESHYWAHYARLLAYSAEDFPRAHEAIGKALDLEQADDILHHMAGMIYRSELKSLTASSRQASPVYGSEGLPAIIELYEKTETAFATAADLNRNSAYPHVALAQTCVMLIEWGYKCSGESSYAAFLRAQRGLFFVNLLDGAEEALLAAREIRADDAIPFVVQAAEADLRAFYDDFAGLLESWHNILDRSDVLKVPVRRRLVRAYKLRAGRWSRADAKDRRQALDLLNANLRDDPSDSRSIRLWFEVARFEGGSLDRAAELAAYWSFADPTRESTFYEYVTQVLLYLGKRKTSLVKYERKLDECRERASKFPRRRSIYEWLGKGDGLSGLVDNRDLMDWERSRTDVEDPAQLLRVPGRITKLRGQRAGYLEIAPGVQAFFNPSVGGFLEGQHENAVVSTLIGFSYDGLQGWSVRPR